MPTSLLFIASVLIWGSTFLVITVQLGDVSPAVSVVYRFGIGTALLFAWCAWRGEQLWIEWRRQPLLMLQGGLNFGLAYVCTYIAEANLVSALVAVLFSLVVFWNAIGARLCFGTAITWSMLGATALSMLGMLLLFLQPLADAWQTMAAGSAVNQKMFVGLGFALVATLFSSAGSLVAVRVGREHQGNLFVTTAWAMLWGTLSVALVALATGQQWVLPANPTYWAAMLYLSLFGSVLAFIAYFILINRIGPGKASMIGVLIPAVSVLLSMRFENYQPGLTGFIGMALCLTGVMLAIGGISIKNPRRWVMKMARISKHFYARYANRVARAI
ncbi:MAG: EamA family transporter [Pseudomonadota bacterium]